MTSGVRRRWQGAGVRTVLLHPPLLSAVVWRRLAPLLRAAGHDVVVPALAWRDEARWWAQARDAVVDQVGDADAVVAHSGAGALLPVVVDRLPSVRAAVLVDAVLPPPAGALTPPVRLRAHVAGLARDGVLPPWTAWWGSEELERLVPDDRDRADLEASAPRLGPGFFDVGVPAPDGWEPAVRGYVRLSAAYDQEAREAGERGWAVERLDGQHLDLLARPAGVSTALLRLLAPA